MPRPAAREGDSNVCTATAPIPHVGGLISGLTGPRRVEICGGLAATVTSLCECQCPLVPVPNAIATGAPTVLIGGWPAARVLDTTTHGGFVSSGQGRVLIGEYAAAAAKKVFPGRQTFGNCGIRCCEQIIHQTWGLKYLEQWMLTTFINNKYAYDHPNPAKRGGMTIGQIQGILNVFSIQSDLYVNPPRATLAELLMDNRALIATVDPGTYYNIPNIIGQESHAFFITEGEFDEHGQLTHVYLNDTGKGDQGISVEIAWLEKAQKARADFLGKPLYELVAVQRPIWGRLPPSPPIIPPNLPAIFHPTPPPPIALPRRRAPPPPRHPARQVP